MGKNLQDHAVVSIPFTLNMSSAIEIKKSFTFEALFNQMFTGKGEHCIQYRLNTRIWLLQMIFIMVTIPCLYGMLLCFSDQISGFDIPMS